MAELENHVSASVKCAKDLSPSAKIGGPEEAGGRDVLGGDGVGRNWIRPMEAEGTISMAPLRDSCWGSFFNSVGKPFGQTSASPSKSG